MAATRVFHNGKIYTVNKQQPWAEAVALEGNKIVYVGSNEEALKLADAGTQVEDLEGKMMLPGFIDGHIHPFIAVAFTSGVQLSACRTKEEILDAVREYVAANPDNETYFGQGFDDAILANLPALADELDAICADKPMLLVSSSCHGAWCNHKAFEVAGIDKNTPDITPGSNFFVRDEEGNPTGRCIETCYIKVATKANYFPVEKLIKLLKELAGDFASLGYTSFADCGCFPFILDMFDDSLVDFLKSDEFLQRLFGGFYMATTLENAEAALESADWLAKNWKSSDRIGFSFFKIVGDGVLESRSAAMAHPYDDGTAPVPNFTSDEAKQMGLMVAKAGYDLNMHAIGDATNTVALDAAEAIRNAGCSDTRIAISHSQCWEAGSVERAGKLGLFINSTGAWHNSPNQMYKEIVGANIVGFQYPIRSLIDVGCKYGQGSDFPVADGKPDVFTSIEVGMRRRSVGDIDSPEPVDLCEAPTLAESIESFTINNAWQVRMEDKLGSIEVGKLADLVIIDKNLFDVPTEEIHACKVMETIRDGVTTFKA